MSDNEERIGMLVQRGWGTYLAKCAACAWEWKGGRDEAEKHLRGHASMVHPQPIYIYRPAPAGRPATTYETEGDE